MSTITSPSPRVNRKSSPRPLVVSLVLTINTTPYEVDPIANAPGGVKSYRLSKCSGDGATYDLDSFADRIECSCPSYQKTHAGTSSLCKHGRALVMVGLVDYPTAGTHSTCTIAPLPVEPKDDKMSPFVEPTPDPYASALAKLVTIAEAELAVRATAEGAAEEAERAEFCREYEARVLAERMAGDGAEQPHGVKSSDTCSLSNRNSAPIKGGSGASDYLPARVIAPAFDRAFYDCQNAVAEGRALWLEHRHLHTSEPIGARHVEADEPCCDPLEVSPCSACLNEGPADLSDPAWGDEWRYELGPDEEPFAAWIRRQADAYATSGTARGAWLAGKIARLAEQAAFLDASTPEAFDDRLDAALDAESARIDARRAACG